MKGSRFYILIAVILVFISAYILDISSEIRNLLLASAILILQFIIMWRSQTNSISEFIFKVWSTQWMFGIFFSSILIYSFVDDEMNYWNQVAIAEAIAFGVFYAIHHRFNTYCIDNKGIRNLTTEEVINLSLITDIRIEKDCIRIDTTKYQNDLTVKADVLYTPTWDELVSRFQSLRSNRG